jgi:rubrerythrin
MTNMPVQWSGADELLDFAIAREEEAVGFYTDLADNATDPAMIEVFQEFANMELGHKTRLENIKESGELAPISDKIADLKIADYLVDVEPSPDMSYQDVLVMAIKKEDSAQRLYTDLANLAPPGGIQDALRMLSDDEAQHKVRFETEYDDNVLTDN